MWYIVPHCNRTLPYNQIVEEIYYMHVKVCHVVIKAYMYIIWQMLSTKG